MPELYSPEWVADFNIAVADLDVATADTGGSLAASGGRFRVVQVVHEAPGRGELRVALVVADGRLRLELPPTDGEGEEAGRANVTVSLAYDDAVALSRGELDPAALIGAGRVKVRGDLSVLVASQALMAAAAPRLVGLQGTTTY